MGKKEKSENTLFNVSVVQQVFKALLETVVTPPANCDIKPIPAPTITAALGDKLPREVRGEDGNIMAAMIIMGYKADFTHNGQFSFPIPSCTFRVIIKR